MPGITGAAPFIQGLGFIMRNDRVYTPLVRGLDPEYEESVSQIPRHMIRGEYDVSDEGVLVGVDLARQMGVMVGDTILVYSPQNFKMADEVYLPEELVVRGVYELGMWEFDSGFILTSLRRPALYLISNPVSTPYRL